MMLARRHGRVVVPGTDICLLTSTSKMPSRSWSLPAGDSCPAAVYGPGAICSSCYAQKGMYSFSRVRRAQATRFRWTVECLRTVPGTAEFVDVLTGAIGGGGTYFRIHDSGDFFSPAYVSAWAQVARALPSVAFWAPTRTWRFLGMARWAVALAELGSLPNVTLRPSALRFDDAAPVVEGWAAGSTATVGGGWGFTCPAPRQGNTCGSCRVCWDAKETAVSYHRH